VNGRPVRERELQATIVDACRVLGYRVAHFRPARTAHGWRTPMTGDIGFPDLVCARPGRMLALELKAAGRRLGPGQAGWLDALHGAMVHAQVVTPAGLDALLALLARKEQAHP
jgi:hypothetical protein